MARCRILGKRFSEIGIKNILLSDTTGVADVEKISQLFEKIPAKFPEIHFGGIFIINMKIQLHKTESSLR